MTEADAVTLIDRLEVRTARVTVLEAALEVIGGRLLGDVTREQLLRDIRAALSGERKGAA